MTQYNLHPLYIGHESSNYPTYSNCLNPYNYKDLGHQFEPYQREQNMYYNTRQLNPISLVFLTLSG